MVLTQEMVLRYQKNNGWVYLLRAEGTNRYKIGRSVRPVERLERLKNQSPYPLIVVDVAWSADSVLLESQLHKGFDKIRVYGEWFETADDRYIEMGFYVYRQDTEELSLDISAAIIKTALARQIYCNERTESMLKSVVNRFLHDVSGLDFFLASINFLASDLTEKAVLKAMKQVEPPKTLSEYDLDEYTRNLWYELEAVISPLLQSFLWGFEIGRYE
jgi:Meiotically up-regulated gene 113